MHATNHRLNKNKIQILYVISHFTNLIKLTIEAQTFDKQLQPCHVFISSQTFHETFSCSIGSLIFCCPNFGQKRLSFAKIQSFRSVRSVWLRWFEFHLPQSPTKTDPAIVLLGFRQDGKCLPVRVPLPRAIVGSISFSHSSARRLIGFVGLPWKPLL